MLNWIETDSGSLINAPGVSRMAFVEVPVKDLPLVKVVLLAWTQATSLQDRYQCLRSEYDEDILFHLMDHLQRSEGFYSVWEREDELGYHQQKEPLGETIPEAPIEVVRS